jgi:nitroreductase
MKTTLKTFMDMLRARRSVREFEPEPIEEEKLERLKEAVLRSPSSRNFDPWQFVFVTEKPILQALSSLKPHGSEFLRKAALGIVVCGNEAKSDVWVEDCAIASILAQLAAQSLGLGSCWVQVRKRFHSEGISSEDYVRNTLGLPEDLRVLSIIGVGIPAEHPEPIAENTLKRDRIHDNKW